MKRVMLSIGVLLVAIIIFGAFLLLAPPRTSSLKAELIHQPNQTTATNIEIQLSNGSGRIVNFALWVEVLKDGKWVQDSSWAPKTAGQLHWIRGGDSSTVQLPMPTGEKWRFKIMGEEQPSTLKWKWLQIGNSKPRQWYFYVYPNQ
jgi:hypothetical protein